MRVLALALVAVCALAAAAPFASAHDVHTPEPGYYNSDLTTRHYLHSTGWTVYWYVHHVGDGAPVGQVKECRDAGLSKHRCISGNGGYLWRDASSGVWHVRLKFDEDRFQVDGHWNQPRGGIMCYLHHNGEREHTSLNCTPPFGFGFAS